MRLAGKAFLTIYLLLIRIYNTNTYYEKNEKKRIEKL